MYAYADFFGAMLVWHSMFSVLSGCGSNPFHRCIGNVLSTPFNIDLKWSLIVLMAFLVVLQQYMFEGTFWYSMPCFLIAFRYSSVASLLKMSFLILMLLWVSHCISFLYALHISPEVPFFMGSTRMRFPSVSHSILMYLFPWLDTMGLVDVHNLLDVLYVETYFSLSVLWCMDYFCVLVLYCFLAGLYFLLVLPHVSF